MSRKIFIGDKVKTAYGIGIVQDARSWREKINELSDYEAVEFTNKCRVESGLNYKEDWVELLVSVGGIVRRMIGHQVEVIDGRDVDESSID